VPNALASFELVVRASHWLRWPWLDLGAFLIRFADDFVIGFTHEEDAHRVLNVLPQRFCKYGLTIHPEKTRLVAFRKPRGPKPPQGSHRPGTFGFLGFTHYWARSRKGNWVVKRKTASDRLSRSLHAISQWCRRNRHIPIVDQHRILCQKLRGHFNYYGIMGNSAALRDFHYFATRSWYKWLRRRNRRRPSWDWFDRILDRFPLPRPVAVHSKYRAANT
jgi:RNA-directed DNA polymerase